MKKLPEDFKPMTVVTRAYIECQVCQNKIDVDHWNRPDTGFKAPDGEDRHFSRHCIDCDTKYEIYAKGHGEFLARVVPTTEWQGLLLVKHQDVHTYLLVEIDLHMRDGVVDTDMQYYIDEHTCPTNWLNVIAISDAGDIDPHGTFRFCRAMSYQQIQEKYAITRGVLRHGNEQNEALLIVFPELGEDSADALANVPDGAVVH